MQETMISGCQRQQKKPPLALQTCLHYVRQTKGNLKTTTRREVGLCT